MPQVPINPHEWLLVEGQPERNGVTLTTRDFKNGARFLVDRFILRGNNIEALQGKPARTAIRRMYYALQFAHAGIEENRKAWREAAGQQQLEYVKANSEACGFTRKILQQFDTQQQLVAIRSLRNFMQETGDWPENPSGPISNGGVIAGWVKLPSP